MDTGNEEEEKRAAAILAFVRAYRHSPGPIVVQEVFDAKHRVLAARFDVSRKALRAIKQRMEREMKAKAPKAPRHKRLTVCPHCQGNLVATNA